MLRSCSRCGKLHKIGERCNVAYQREYKSTYNERKLRSTNKWTEKSEEIRKDSKFLCAVCYDKGIYQYNNLEIHHIKKLRERPDLLLDNYNLICLCNKCHKLADAGMIETEYLLKLAKEREDK